MPKGSEASAMAAIFGLLSQVSAEIQKKRKEQEALSKGERFNREELERGSEYEVAIDPATGRPAYKFKHERPKEPNMLNQAKQEEQVMLNQLLRQQMQGAGALPVNQQDVTQQDIASFLNQILGNRQGPTSISTNAYPIDQYGNPQTYPQAFQQEGIVPAAVVKRGKTAGDILSSIKGRKQAQEEVVYDNSVDNGQQPPTRRIRVRLKSSGKTGTIEADEFDPNLYERI